MRKPPSGVAATLTGAFNVAEVARPPSPEEPNSPVPATVAIVPVESIRRTRALPVSAIRTLPSAATATSLAPSIRARVADPPSPLKPARPVPATTVKTPSRPSRKTRVESAIRTPPSCIAVNPDGSTSALPFASPFGRAASPPPAMGKTDHCVAGGSAPELPAPTARTPPSNVPSNDTATHATLRLRPPRHAVSSRTGRGTCGISTVARAGSRRPRGGARHSIRSGGSCSCRGHSGLPRDEIARNRAKLTRSSRLTGEPMGDL